MTRHCPRHKNIKSPFDQRQPSRTRVTGRSNPDAPSAEQLAAFDRMCTAPAVEHEYRDNVPAGELDAYARRHGMRPLKPPPYKFVERSHAAKTDARKARRLT